MSSNPWQSKLRWRQSVHARGGAARTPARWSSWILQQARYEASLAERRYAACDPDNRLIAAQLEKSWEATLRRVQACEARLDAMQSSRPAG